MSLQKLCRPFRQLLHWTSTSTLNGIAATNCSTPETRQLALRMPGSRTYSSTSAGAGGGASEPSSTMFELRTYSLKTHLITPYMNATSAHADLRKKLNPGWMGFWSTETGGSLGEVKHLYSFPGGWEERDEVRRALSEDATWTKEYLPVVRPMIDRQESMIFKEALDCMAACGQPSARHLAGVARLEAPVYELRTYQLAAGYDSVPSLVKLFGQGLPSRVAADGCGECMFMGFTDVGLLNVFIELWRHSSTSACMGARQGARQASRWRETIAAVAPLCHSFRTELLQPAAFSPWH